MSEHATQAGREVIAEATEALKNGEKVSLHVHGSDTPLPLTEITPGTYAFLAQSAGSARYSVAYSAVAYIKISQSGGGSRMTTGNF
jgi:hypothetical protein